MEIGIPKTTDIIKILKLINEGELRIPEFQRDFRWEINDICELIGSLLSGYPAGVLLFWNVSDREEKLSSRLIEGVNEGNVNPVKLLILDGQQRLTSLYQLFYRPFAELRGGRKRVFFLDLDKIKKGDLYESTEYFSFRDIRRKGLSQRIEQYKRNLLPFNILLNEKELWNWVDGYIKYKLSNVEEDNPDVSVVDEFIKLKNELRALYLERDKPVYNLINYKFHIIELPSNLSFEAVATIFEKLNTTGQPLNIFEILTAKFFNEINLRDIWANTRREFDLIDKFSKDEKDTTLAILILKAILLQKSLEKPEYEKLECKRKNLLEDMTPEDIKEYWQKITTIFNSALSKLKVELGCPSLEYLPYITILVPFSLAIKYVENKLSYEKKAAALKKLFTWYWSSIFSGRYDSATDTKSKLDIKQLIEWFNDDGKKPSAVKEFNIDVLTLSDVTRGAAYKGVINILIRNDCKDFVTGENIKGLIENNPKLVDSHHIFPIKYLKRRYGENSEEYKLRDSVLNRTLIRRDTNRNYIKDDSPSSYVLGIERRNPDIISILETHLIPKDELLNDDFPEFLKKRETLIKNKIKETLFMNT